MNNDITKIKQKLSTSVVDFRLPRYAQLPNMGLYLEQVVRYINGFLESVSCADITPSMISNYVKKGIIPPPQKKQYFADQIAYLIFIAITKNVISFENIEALFEMQKRGFTIAMAYDYFCAELENMLAFIFGHKEKPDENLGVTRTEQRAFLRHVIISVSHSLYIRAYFSELQKQNESKNENDKTKE